MHSDPILIPARTRFTAQDITHWQGMGHRSLEQALSEADVLVSTPHSGAAIPEELQKYLAPELTQRLQYDFSDVATASVVRRWAELDPRVIAVLNPHPRMVRDPNRRKPADVEATLLQALDRVAEAGKWNPVDLAGVDAIRPVTFSFFPILRVPRGTEELRRLCTDFADVAAAGLEVYERTRDELIDKLLTIGLSTAHGGRRARLTVLSFHDTMNTTTTPDGAVNVPRDAKDRLPQVVALSNRGDEHGRPRMESDPPSMDPSRLRTLADAHREGFEVSDAQDVQLNRPYLGSQEIIAARERFARFHTQHPESGVLTDAVQAEFLREFLLGEEFANALRRPGADWPAEDPERVDYLARACQRTWDLYRGR